MCIYIHTLITLFFLPCLKFIANFLEARLKQLGMHRKNNKIEIMSVVLVSFLVHKRLSTILYWQFEHCGS